MLLTVGLLSCIHHIENGILLSFPMRLCQQRFFIPFDSPDAVNQDSTSERGSARKHRPVRHLIGTIARPTFLKGRPLQILAWPVICISLSALLWYALLSKIDADKVEFRQNALQDASALARAYAQYVTHAIEQADQITLRVKYDWEHSRGTLNLANLAQSGVFRGTGIVNMTVIDREGRPVTGTAYPRANAPSLADRDSFQFHRNDPSNVLMIGKPVRGRLAGKMLVTFTRRLNAADAVFDGIVAVGVEPSYFTDFYAGSNPGKTGFLAVVGADGTVRSAKIGGAMEETNPGPLRAVPLFDSRAGTGFLRGKDWFRDNLSRFVAWETLRPYPLVAIVGLTEEEYLAPYQRAWTLYRKIAIAGTAFLLMFAVFATAMSIRVASKKQQAEEVRRTYRLATEGGQEGFYIVQALRDRRNNIVDFEIVDCNERGAAFYGTTKAHLMGAKLSTLHSAPYFDELMNTFRGAMISGFHEDEVRLPREDRLRMEWARRRLVRSGTGLAVTVQDISERKMAEERIAFLAHHDPLTHLPNRLLARDRFELAMEAAARADTGIAMLFLDLDNFKQINDSFGHQVGDQLLIEVVKRLKASIGDADTVCRHGGDEFIIIVSNFSGISALGQIAQNIVDAVSEPVDIGSHPFNTTASIGISVYPHDGADFDALLKNADTAMYEAKASGRNAYRFFTEKMNVDARERLGLQTQLRRAVQRNELLLDYQPQIDLATGGVIGMEALIRWQHPDLGIVSPARFIPLAEETGLIIPIGEWALNNACEQARTWLDSGLSPFIVAVNLSAVQFRRGNILETVSRALERARIPPVMLELELTESILLQDVEGATRTIHELKSLGVKLSIDDFGTGYSSLSYLKRLKVDKLKIDQSFVRDIVKDADDLAIVRSVIQLGRTLQLRVIAEGVESAEQLDSLKANGCDEAQGYYFCRPLPPRELSDWLASRQSPARVT